MKRSLLIGLVVLAVVVAFVTMWMTSDENQSDSLTPPSKEDKAKSPNPFPQVSLDRAVRTRALLNAGNVPITFWGKVVDESGVGIIGVNIKYRIQRAGRLAVGGTIVEDGILASLLSNQDGSFSITNTSGKILSMVEFTKDGYDLSSNQNVVFGYYGTPELHTPKKESPQVFMMMSNKTQVDVSSISQQIRLHWNGKAIRIDINSGRTSPTGNLIITASRTASTGRFGWSFALTIDGGEMREAEVGTVLVAPESGYQPSWDCKFSANANPWRFARDANVYYRMGRKYGRLKLQIYADAGPNDVSLYLERFVNTSGGRNTEGRH